MVRLLVPYYKEKNPERRSELDYALKMNLLHAPVDEIYLIVENDENMVDIDLIKSDKLIVVITNTRQTFKSLFEMANDIAEEDDINIFCNSDIYLPESFGKVYPHLKNNTVLTLTRWDLHPNGDIRLFNVNYSQDVWAYKGKLKNMDRMDINVHCGIIGCDNVVAAQLHKVGYQLINPAQDIHSIHVHWSAIRNYTADIRCAGDYLWLSHHKLGELPVYEKRFCPDDWKKGSGPDYI